MKPLSAKSGVGLGVFLLVLGTVLATGSGHLTVQDEVGLYAMTASAVDAGRMDVPRNVNTEGGFEGLDGRYYTPFGIGQPLLATPLLGWIRLALPRTAPPYLEITVLIAFNAVVHAATAALLALMALEMGTGRRRAIAIALAFAFGTHAWTYGRTFFAEPLTGLCGLLAVRSLMRARAGSMGHAAAGGLFAGFAVLTRFFSVLLLPVYGLYLLLPRLEEPTAADDEQQVPARRDLGWRRAALFGAAAGIFVLACLARNRVLLGSWTDTGYRLLPTGEVRGFTYPIWRGLLVLLVAPGKSLFVFAPPVLLGLSVWGRWRRERPAEAWLVLALGVVYLAAYAHWCAPEGGYAWGPRFLVPLVPLWLLPLTLTGWSRRWTMALGGLAAVGLAVALLSLPVDFAQRLRVRDTEYYNRQGRYDLLFTPFGDHLGEAWRVRDQLLPTPETIGRSRRHLIPDWTGEPDFWFVHLLREGLSAGWIGAMLGAQALVAFVGLLLLKRAARTEPSKPNRPPPSE